MQQKSFMRHDSSYTKMAEDSAYGRSLMASHSAYAYVDPPGTRMEEESAYLPQRNNIKMYSDDQNNQDFCLTCYDILPTVVREKLNLKAFDCCRLCSSSSRRATCAHYFWCDICFASGIHFGKTTQLFLLLQMKKSIDFALGQSDTEILELLLKDVISRSPDHPPTERELFEKLRADVGGGFGYNVVTANSIVSLYMSLVDTTSLPGGYKVLPRDSRK